MNKYYIVGKSDIVPKYKERIKRIIEAENNIEAVEYFMLDNINYEFVEMYKKVTFNEFEKQKINNIQIRSNDKINNGEPYIEYIPEKNQSQLNCNITKGF